MKIQTWCVSVVCVLVSVGASLALCYALSPGIFTTTAPYAEDPNLLQYAPPLLSEYDCTKASDTYIGKMATFGILPAAHAVRWSGFRGLCLMAVTYEHRPRGGQSYRVVEVVDVSYMRRVFIFTTYGKVDPEQFLDYSVDLDRPEPRRARYGRER